MSTAKWQVRKWGQVVESTLWMFQFICVSGPLCYDITQDICNKFLSNTKDKPLMVAVAKYRCNFFMRLNPRLREAYISQDRRSVSSRSKNNYWILSLQLPQCTEDEICKEITDMPGEFLVNPICQCPGQMSCPSVAPKNVEVMVYDKQVCRMI